MDTPAITVQQARERLAQGVRLLDVRTPAEFAGVHASGARNQPLERLDAAALRQELPADQPLMVICQSGTRSRMAAEALAAAGFTTVIQVDGGTAGWIAAGLPVERGASRVIGLERQVRIGAGSLVLLGVVLATCVHPGFIWLSGGVGAGLVFAGITDICAMGLLLARMPWNQRAAACSTPAKPGQADQLA